MSFSKSIESISIVSLFNLSISFKLIFYLPVSVFSADIFPEYIHLFRVIKLIPNNLDACPVVYQSRSSSFNLSQSSYQSIHFILIGHKFSTLNSFYKRLISPSVPSALPSGTEPCPCPGLPLFLLV
jgi:hypothetical protein